MSEREYDLVVLVPDKNLEASVDKILLRHQSLNIRPIRLQKIYVHPERDPGCFLAAHNFLRTFTEQCDHGLVIFDREGSGQESESREALEQIVERRLSQAGWEDRAAVTVIDPELEAWVWSTSPHVKDILGWANRTPPLRDWLHTEGFLASGEIKPKRPKEAMEKALRLAKIPRSSTIYGQLAEKVSLEQCIDPAFLKLKTTLQAWFTTQIDC